MIEYGPLSEDRLPEVRSLLSYAFRPTAGPVRPGPDEELPGPARVGERRALVEGDEIVCAAVHHWFEARVRGTWIDLAGLTGVATPPERRRRGLVRRLARESLAEYRDRGCALAALWPFKHPFYGRLGWGLAGRYALVRGSPAALDPPAAEATGTFRRVDDADADAVGRLDPVLEAHGAGTSLAIRRTEAWWRHRVFQGWETDPYVYAWERGGRTRGYLVYRFDEGDAGTELHVTDHAYADHEARLNLLRFLGGHDGQVGTVQLYGRAEPSILDVVADPAALEVAVKPGPMVRVVDVPTALGAVPSTDDVEPVVLAVEDGLAAWNDGGFRIAPGDGGLVCDRDDAASPDATVDVATLSQLVVGHLPVPLAADLGRLQVRDGGARGTLEALFPPREVFLREGF